MHCKKISIIHFVLTIITAGSLLNLAGGYCMNKQKSNNSQQATNKSQSGATSSTMQNQSTSAKQQASKSEYGTLTAKEDANNDYQ